MSPSKKKQKYGMVLGVAGAIAFITVAAFNFSNSDNVRANDEKVQSNIESQVDSTDITREQVQEAVTCEAAYSQADVYYNGDYYNELEGLDDLLSGKYSDKDIKEGLRALIGYQSKTTNVKAFGKSIVGTDVKHPQYKGTGKGSLAELWQYSERSFNDTHPDKAFRLFYSNAYGTSLGDYSTTVNREHVWPQSLSGGLFGKSGAGADGHHIRPTNSRLNSARSNRKYGDLEENEVDHTYFAQDSAKSYNELSGYYTEDYVSQSYKGHLAGYASHDIFEPRDDYKGDVARIIAYMCVHYESLEGIVNNVMENGYDTIVEWNRLDPVDDYELNRNNVVADFQGNRNPFIDAPGLIDVLWAKDCTVLEAN